jgi:hypothetical protein
MPCTDLERLKESAYCGHCIDSSEEDEIFRAIAEIEALRRVVEAGAWALTEEGNLSNLSHYVTEYDKLCEGE